MRALYERLLRRHFVAINQRAQAARGPESTGYDGRVLFVLVLVALVLTFQQYLGDRPSFEHLVGRRVVDRWHELSAYGWWAGAKVVGYLVVPMIVVAAWGGRLSDHGLTFAGLRRHAFIYVALFGAVLPLVVVASFTDAFRGTYPFYRLASRSWLDLLAWELMYAASFVALEFFYRGFMLFSLERTLGAYAIPVMIVPYCMIHFGKPVAEVVAAIFAGVVLGTLAMVTRSIWCGVLLHISVAWTMDLLALVDGRLPLSFWPPAP